MSQYTTDVGGLAIDPAYAGAAPAADVADLDPTAADRAAAAVWADELGEVDGLLVRSGVRWDLVRWLPRSCRWRLALAIRQQEMPAGTRTCWEGGQVWLDEVRRRVAAQSWYACRKETWLAAAECLAASVPRCRRPLTQVTQAELAERIGRSDRYVRMILAWLEREGLLGRVVVGTRYPRMEAPSDETEEERQAREAATEAACQARQERRRRGRAHAQAELEALRTGQAASAPDGLEEFRSPDPDLEEETEERLLNIASVYELRVQAPVEDFPPTPPPAPGGPDNVVDLAAARAHRAHRPDEPTQGCPGCAKTPVSSADAENFRPIRAPQEIKSPDAAGGVDEEGGASRRSDMKGVCAGQRGQNQSESHRSQAERAAAALLGRSAEPWATGQALPAALTTGVSIRLVAALISPHLARGWTIPELAWQILTRGGQYPHLPHHISNPAGWIRVALRAVPAMRPAVADAVADVEEDNRRAAAMREMVIRRRDMERGRGAQAAIAACPLCDEHGWVPLDGGGPAVRCDHQAPDAELELADDAPADSASSGSTPAAETTVGTGRRRWEALRQQLLDQARAHQPPATPAPGAVVRADRYQPAIDRAARERRSSSRTYR